MRPEQHIFDRPAFLHELRCTNDPCVCRVLYPVSSEQAFDYNQMVGVSDESDKVSRGASLVLTPLAARRRVHGSKP